MFVIIGKKYGTKTDSPNRDRAEDQRAGELGSETTQESDAGPSAGRARTHSGGTNRAACLFLLGSARRPRRLARVGLVTRRRRTESPLTRGTPTVWRCGLAAGGLPAPVLLL